jgi:N-carbamoyl-L-amino-acid hydrolase
MIFEPGVFNIIPGRVILSMEFRAPESELLEKLESALITHAKLSAEQFGLDLETEWVGRGEPAPMSELAQQAICEAADSLHLKYITLSSGAGHDANKFAPICPTGMIFVPSVNGFSHSPQEYSRWEDCTKGANVLLQGALRLAYSVR